MAAKLSSLRRLPRGRGDRQCWPAAHRCPQARRCCRTGRSSASGAGSTECARSSFSHLAPHAAGASGKTHQCVRWQPRHLTRMTFPRDRWWRRPTRAVHLRRPGEDWPKIGNVWPAAPLTRPLRLGDAIPEAFSRGGCAGRARRACVGQSCCVCKEASQSVRFRVSC